MLTPSSIYFSVCSKYYWSIYIWEEHVRGLVEIWWRSHEYYEHLWVFEFHQFSFYHWFLRFRVVFRNFASPCVYNLLLVIDFWSFCRLMRPSLFLIISCCGCSSLSSNQSLFLCFELNGVCTGCDISILHLVSEFSEFIFLLPGNWISSILTLSLWV